MFLCAEYREREHAVERQGPGSADGHDGHVGGARRPAAEPAADGAGSQQVLLRGARHDRHLAHAASCRRTARAAHLAHEDVLPEVQRGHVHQLLVDDLLLPRRAPSRGVAERH